MKRRNKSCLSHKQNIAGSTPVSATRKNLCGLHETSVHETCKKLINVQRDFWYAIRNVTTAVEQVQ